MSCDEARERVHRVLDGDLMLVEARRELDDHLASCAGCREASGELHSIQEALRSMPAAAFPDAALEAVWDRTTRSRRLWRSMLDWRAAAAAAVLALAIYGAWGPARVAGVAEPTPEEVARATEEARMVLGLTARALNDAKQAAMEEVLAGEVSPALRRAPVPWPGGGAVERRGTRNGV